MPLLFLFPFRLKVGAHPISNDSPTLGTVSVAVRFLAAVPGLRMAQLRAAGLSGNCAARMASTSWLSGPRADPTKKSSFERSVAVVVRQGAV